MFGEIETGISAPAPCPRPLSRSILAVTMAASLVIGLGFGISAISSPNAQRRLRLAYNATALIKGETAKAINYAMAHYLPADGQIQTLQAVIRWRVFGAGGQTIFVGGDNWLYLVDEIRAVPNAEANMAARAELLRRVAARLTAQKIDLVVLIVPMKARMVPASSPPPLSAEARSRLVNWNRLIAPLGLNSRNLLDDFSAENGRDSLWPRTDSHWNQKGGAVAAHAVAATVITPINRTHHFVTSADAADTPLVNDLIKLMGLAQLPADTFVRLRPHGDVQHLEHTEEIVDPQVQIDQLADDSSTEVVLVGSSYSLRGNFGGRLQEALSAPVLNVAIDGGGFARSAQRYFNSNAFVQSPPRLVIWEIPERVVVRPIGEDEAALAAWADSPAPPPTHP